MSRRVRYCAFAVVVVGLLAHALYYGFITDDAYISFVYARNLAERGQLVFNPGTANPVEGYSNFLWTVVLAGFDLVGVAPEHSALILGLIFAVGAMWVALELTDYLTASRGGDRFGGSADDREGWGVVAAALLAGSAGFACWTSGGLETQLFTFLVLASLYAYVRGRAEGAWLRRVGWLLGLAALTRPEGALIFAVCCVHRVGWNLARERRFLPSRDELWAIGGFAGLWLPHLLWRWSYYGYPFPNTYYVKAGEATESYRSALRSAGLYYVWQWLRQSGVLWGAPLLVAGALSPGRRYFGTLAAAVTAAYLLYTIRVGGDFMGLFRFVMPLYPIAAVLVGVGLWSLARRLATRYSRLGRRLAVVVAVVVVGSHGLAGAADSREAMRDGNWASDRGIDTPAFLDVYARDRAAVGRHLKPCMRADDFSIFGGAGAQPYAGRLRGIDVFGLVSERVAHEVAPSRPRAGHNKWAPDDLLLEHRPDFVFSCYSIHRDARAPQLNCNPAFWLRHGYEQITLHIPGLVQQGEYYTFFARSERHFECPGRVE